MASLLERIVERLVSRDDMDFTTDPKAAMLREPRSSAHYLMYLVIAFIVIGFVWAGRARLDEVAVGQGRVIPSSHVQLIQNLEGGILAELTVAEGQSVQKDQVLARIDDTRFVSSYREARARYLALLASAARLTAESQGTAPRFPEEVSKERPDLVRIETALYQSRREALEVGLAGLRRSLDLANRELEMSEPLVDKGAISAVEVLRLRRQVNEINAAIDDRSNRFRADAHGELSKVRADLAGLTESNVAAQDRVKRTVLRSPVNGVVKKINLTTVGAVIQPGIDIMEVVPIEDSLLVETQIRPDDIAFLHAGQDATVKISAYDFSIYGGLAGKVEFVSADAIVDEKRGLSFYKVLVRTRENHLLHAGQRLPIIPGMNAQVDVLTGHKTVLDYLLKPILKARDSALRER
ncbi:MAG TPA: HlyD family type I secretion periplasmic adaptor subunit [Burkholderiales bacterium]